MQCLLRLLSEARATQAQEMRLRKHRALLVTATATCNTAECAAEHRGGAVEVAAGERDRATRLVDADFVPDVGSAGGLAVRVLFHLRKRAIDFRRLPGPLQRVEINGGQEWKYLLVSLGPDVRRYFAPALLHRAARELDVP